MHRIIQFNQKTGLKLHIDMNAKLRQEAKNDFGKYCVKLVNDAVFGKIMENVRKQRDIKLNTTEIRRNYFVSEPNYQTTTWKT